MLSVSGVAVRPRDERQEIVDADAHHPDAFATSDGSVCVLRCRLLRSTVNYGGGGGGGWEILETDLIGQNLSTVLLTVAIQKDASSSRCIYCVSAEVRARTTSKPKFGEWRVWIGGLRTYTCVGMSQ